MVHRCISDVGFLTKTRPRFFHRFEKETRETAAYDMHGQKHDTLNMLQCKDLQKCRKSKTADKRESKRPR